MRRRQPGGDRKLGEGPAPLLRRRPPVVASRPLSYTAIAAYAECPYRFYLERVLGLKDNKGDSAEDVASFASASAREVGAARGALVHDLLEGAKPTGGESPLLSTSGATPLRRALIVRPVIFWQMFWSRFAVG